MDIGANSIKVVELVSENKRAKLMTYGYVERPASDGGLLLDDPKTAGALLAQLCKQSGCRATSAMAALPTSNIFSTILSVPSVKDQKQLKPVIDAEIEKLSPLPLSEMITYSTFLGGGEKAEKAEKTAEAVKEGKPDKYVRVLVTGAAKTLVQKYIEIFKVAKLQLQALDTESFALIRSLIGKDRSAIMVVDMGAKRTNLTVVEKGIPFVTRSVNIGGDAVTSRIQTTMNVSAEEAESMKRDFGQLGGEGGESGMPPLLESILQPLMNEIRYAFELYANMELTELKKVEKIILTGGSSHLPRIPEALSQTLNVNVYRGNPWARIVYPKDLGVVLEEIGPRMSVAAGLAMRDME